ncbi:MAG: ATP-binding cassette domain-containing protein [Nitriliruptorales bacterium]|nr:ATP-binding cassette domain-containing protein [Nitriliruptorales bacterium]
MNTVALDQVVVRFGGVTALQQIELSVADRELVGLVGPNGAGKSTLLAAIGGALRPQEGRVRFKDRDVTRFPAHRRARMGIGRTFQHPALFDSLTVRENLTVGRDRPRHRGREKARHHDARAEELLAAMDLADWCDVASRDLPYGIKKLIDVARALMRRPSLLLLDEPGAGLNASEKERLAGLLVRLHATEGFGAIVVEHDVDFVMGLSNRVYALDFGEVIACGPPDQVRRDPRVIEAFLGAA